MIQIVGNRIPHISTTRMNRLIALAVRRYALSTTGSFDMMAHDNSGDAERKKWSWKNGLSAFVLILALGCLVATVWIAWQLRNYEPFTARDYYPSRPNSYQVSFIEGNADIALPPSAHDIYAYTTGFRDIFIQVRFSMSANELDQFIESTLCQESLREMEPSQQSTSDGTSEWWTPDQAEYLEGCTGSKDHSHQTVMIDRTRQSVYIVFVSTSTY
jgi:hypothetical protein